MAVVCRQSGEVPAFGVIRQPWELVLLPQYVSSSALDEQAARGCPHGGDAAEGHREPLSRPLDDPRLRHRIAQAHGSCG